MRGGLRLYQDANVTRFEPGRWSQPHCNVSFSSTRMREGKVKRRNGEYMCVREQVLEEEEVVTVFIQRDAA